MWVGGRSPAAAAAGTYCALLIFSSLGHRSSAAAYESGSGTTGPSRPITSHHRAQARERSGGRPLDNRRRSDNNNNNNNAQPPPLAGGAFSPSMYTRVPREEEGADINSRGAEVGGRERETYEGQESSSPRRQQEQQQDYGRTAAGWPSSSSPPSSPPLSSFDQPKFGRYTTTGANSNNDNDNGDDSGDFYTNSQNQDQNNYPVEKTPGSFGGRSVVSGRGDAIAAARQQALLAAGRPAGGGGGGAVGERPQEGFDYQQQVDQEYVMEESRGAPAAVYGEQGAEGVGRGEGTPELNTPQRTPLEEQAYQNKYRHQHSQIQGQAVGTRQQASTMLRRAGGGGVFYLFFVLVCRSLSHYEHSDQVKGSFRGVLMAPAVALFLGNMVCMCLALVQSATASQKARMKTMLSVDAFAEGVLLLFNLFSLLASDRHMPKEEFISRMLGSALFMFLCFTFAKARWVAEGAF